MVVRALATVPCGPDAQTRPAWHADIETLLGGLETDWDGLSDGAAAARLAKGGPNRLPAAPRVSALVILGDQLRSVVVGLLIAATVLSLLIGDRLEAERLRKPGQRSVGPGGRHPIT